MSKRFLATIEGAVTKLNEERSKLTRERIGMHFCDCEFCERNGSETELKKVTERIEQIDNEIKVLRRYKESVHV